MINEHVRSSRAGGLPFYKGGKDIWMTDNGIWWFTVIWIGLFLIGWIVYAGFINSQPIEHTYTKNPGAPGTLTSQRYTLNWIVISMSTFALGLLLFFMLLMLIVRKNFGCHMIWFLLSIIMLAIVIFAIVTLSIEYGDCNDADQPNNICNDFKWCCVHANDPANECPNFAVCPGVLQDDLAPNTQFLGLYWSLVSVTILYIIWFIVLLVYWFSPAPPDNEVEKEKEEEEEEQQMQASSSEIQYRQPKYYSSSPPLKNVIVDWDGVRKRHK